MFVWNESPCPLFECWKAQRKIKDELIRFINQTQLLKKIYPNNNLSMRIMARMNSNNVVMLKIILINLLII